MTNFLNHVAESTSKPGPARPIDYVSGAGQSIMASCVRLGPDMGLFFQSHIMGCDIVAHIMIIIPLILP